MKNWILALAVLIAMPAFSQSILTDSYISELEQNIEEIEALKEADLATEREIFMLKYYKKKIREVKIEAGGAAARAIFTTEIKNREPVNDLNSVAVTSITVSFFTELVNLNGKLVTHRWSVHGDVVYTKDFRVGANRWRVWTTKTITPYVDSMVVVQILVDGQAISQETLRITE
jgi:hypothetical protein